MWRASRHDDCVREIWTDAAARSPAEAGAIQWQTRAVKAVLEQGGVDAVNVIMHTLVRNDQPVQESCRRSGPTWQDPAPAGVGRHAQGQARAAAIETWGVEIAVCLFCASLPSSYAAAKGVKVLYLTARLDTDRAGG